MDDLQYVLAASLLTGIARSWGPAGVGHRSLQLDLRTYRPQETPATRHKHPDQR